MKKILLYIIACCGRLLDSTSIKIAKKTLDFILLEKYERKSK